jgi:hypothetical protein
MTTRGRPPDPPIESPDWIPYAAALKDAFNRYRSMPLAIQKLDDALASGRISCKIERIGAKPVRIKRSDRVAMIYLPDELRDGGDEHPYICVNGEPRLGWLFLWNFDRIKFFNISAEARPTIAVKTQKTTAAVGHPVVHEWREIMLFVVQAYLDFRALKANAIVHKLQDRLEAAGIKVPADSELQKAVRQVLNFDKRHQLTPK